MSHWSMFLVSSVLPGRPLLLVLYAFGLCFPYTDAVIVETIITSLSAPTSFSFDISSLVSFVTQPEAALV